eukprot:1267655-Prymnesium_polylepis.1
MSALINSTALGRPAPVPFAGFDGADAAPAAGLPSPPRHPIQGRAERPPRASTVRATAQSEAAAAAAAAAKEARKAQRLAPVIESPAPASPSPPYTSFGGTPVEPSGFDEAQFAMMCQNMEGGSRKAGGGRVGFHQEDVV